MFPILLPATGIGNIGRLNDEIVISVVFASSRQAKGGLLLCDTTLLRRPRGLHTLHRAVPVARGYGREVRVRSTQGVGSKFEFMIPVTPSAIQDQARAPFLPRQAIHAAT